MGIEEKLSIAPMMGRTDRHFRYYMRLITKKTNLYTEMITTSAILKGNKEKLLKFSEFEKPIILQVAGNDPYELKECAKIAEDMGYDGVNLNVGCPSERVQNGYFGACLMANPTLVSRCVSSMLKVVNIPVNVKHRIGIESFDKYDDLKNFVNVVSQGGCRHFIIHARIALLKGLSAQDNRRVPPLRYEDVYLLKKEYPDLRIEINGGIEDLNSAMFHVKHVDSAMIGRAAYNNPYLFSRADEFFYGLKAKPLSRQEILTRMIEYVETQVEEGVASHNIIRHTHGLFFGLPVSKRYKKYLSDNMYLYKESAQVLKNFLNSYDCFWS